MCSRRWAWPFDFEPYGIQADFMDAMYETLDRGGVGIFESPTGTGKSLSIICSSLQWLKDNRGKVVGANEAKEEAEEELDWVSSFEKKRDQDKRSEAEMEQAKRRERVEKGLHGGRKRGMKMKRPFSKNKKAELDDFAPDDSEDDMRRFYSSDEDNYSSGEDEYNLNAPRKIFFVSRTHSQLSQFMNEVRRTPFSKELACIALGSRKQLCTNPNVRALTGVNEKCLDLADKAKRDKSTKKKKSGGSLFTPDGRGDKLPSRSSCPYYDKGSLHRLKDHFLYQAQDIESLANVATEERCCGYYGARASIPEAEVVALPYSMLLHKKTRDSLGISLKGNIVIFDEAHNVIEAINQTHSKTLYLSQLSAAHEELLEYRKRYLARLNAKNKIQINNLIVIVRGLCEYIRKKSCESKSGVQVFSAGTLALDSGIDHVNLFTTLEYLERSRLCQKLRGFSEKYLSSPVEIHNGKHEKTKRTSHVQHVEVFLQGLTNTDDDCKIMLVLDGANTRVRFLMLNPGVYFKEIVDETHAIILAGGTMHPTEDVETQLFPTVPKERIRLFSCGHVIDKKNLLCMTLCNGPTKTRMELNFQNRSKPVVIDEIGRCLLNICTIVPGGTVIFLPSYSYLDQLMARWGQTKLLESLRARTDMFQESRQVGDTGRFLSKYNLACSSGRKKAVLFSVVGGKLSEGINFKDHLARCVVMVGLPYPNPNEPEMKAKMGFLDSAPGGLTSKQYYENQCMKAVNQSIGRAIRHCNDYAAIVLLDSRYSKPAVTSKLPKWITSDIQLPEQFPLFFRNLRAFFN
mmetsp:Transcript_42978/g.69017  ORF Transcript_42978/g.69017 Transcript_42978/m.69017 type:complete len:799 (+) Transcript_42978:75-2471(+)